MFVPAAVLIFTLTSVGTVVSEPYKKGGEAVLSPGSVSDPITSVTWKHGSDIAVEWYGQEMTAYRDFKGRCELDTNTGALRISNLSLKDSGRYTPEINSRIMKPIQMTVITAVPKPTISTHCNPEETQCTLTCNATITDDMGTVTYTWEIGDRQRASSSNQLDIKDDAEFVEKPISCNLTNPVSSERSEDIMSPFKNRSSGAGIIAAVVALIVLVALVALVFLAGYCIWRRKQSENAGFCQYFAWLKTRTNCGRAKEWTPEQTQQDPEAEREKLIAENGAAMKSFELNNTQSPDQNLGSEAATSCEKQEDPNQHQPGPEPTDPSKEAEKPKSTLKIENELGSEKAAAGPTDVRSGAGTSHENQAVTNKDQSEPEPTDPNKEAEKPTSTLKTENELESDQAAAEPKDVSSGAATSPEKQEDLNQGQPGPVSSDSNKEAETSAVAPNAERTLEQDPQQEDSS